MQRENSVAKLLFLLFLDTLCVAVSFCVATFIRFGDQYNYSFVGESQIDSLSTIIVLSILIHLLFDQSKKYMHRSTVGELSSVLLFNFILFIATIVIVYLTHRSDLLSRLQFGYFLVINILITFLIRCGAKLVLRNYYKNDNFQKKVILIVQPSSLSSVINNFSSGTMYHVDGFVVLNEKMAVGTINHQGIDTTFEKLSTELVRFAFDEVFINLPDYNMKELEDLIAGIEDMGAVCHYALSVSSERIGTGKVGIFGDFPVLSYSISTPNTFALVIKRLFDILGALVGLLITAIIFIFLAPAIKLDSPGPVFFSQIRIGKNGRKFKFYKFRSMTANADQQKAELVGNNEMESTLMFKIKNDPRITKVGKFIRKTSLDEFPQFWNVLKGDMSLVGTRPPTEDEYKQYDEHYRRRLSMLPGITGLWQVSGRSSITDFNEVVKLDLQYIDNWSLWLDAEIIVKTIGVLFTHKGAS